MVKLSLELQPSGATLRHLHVCGAEGRVGENAELVLDVHKFENGA